MLTPSFVCALRYLSYTVDVQEYRNLHVPVVRNREYMQVAIIGIWPYNRQLYATLHYTHNFSPTRRCTLYANTLESQRAAVHVAQEPCNA